jgi:hypothetical protein
VAKATELFVLVRRIVHRAGGGIPAAPLKTKESTKRANWLSRRHSCSSISGRITSTDDNLCFRHAYRPDELVESGCVWKGETNAPMRYCGAKARMVRTMNAVPRLVKKIACGIPALSHSRE